MAELAAPLHHTPPRRRSRLRSVAFGLAVAVLAASIPALGYVGSRSILTSQAGKVEAQTNDPRSPGYVEVLEPTPVSLVVQRDSEGAPTALTVLALGNGDTGGSILFVPLDTNLLKPAIFIDRLRTAYDKAGDKSFLKQVATLLNIGLEPVINLDEADWAQMVAPVAPLSIDNPIAVSAGATEFSAGPLQLQADQVGAYLDATAPGQDDLDRLDRHKLVWQAWLAAIATSSADEPIPNSLTGLGPFVATLAGGTVGIDTLAVTPAALIAPDGAVAFQVDQAGMRTQLTEAVPLPVSPGLGDRFSVRVLNGDTGDPIPDEIIRRLVYTGAQVDARGNAAVFGRKVTRIEYHDPNRRETARAVQYVIGGTVVMNPASTDTVDIVITLGSDSIDAVGAAGTGGTGD